ncbi:ligase-associated DNA damage response endonuclease PdeM [Cyclobacterium marinum]|uniref:Metallophosphoesterase n=1 Tax=Cyclobacterium marinum (strain ATCC 25205 / DSM 745 / LMG 13164 / NCIMB 1802) TaxID=880070 RepID=G0J6N6_CYCMS|nr:ligase-associated DNA damage response endonuclease PdeM [Cyclobacterium marinum]AEL28551.1 metallophosphoesterase [Cyclobacterium marinum DSM 745]
MPKIFNPLAADIDGKYIWQHELVTLHLMKEKAIWLEQENALLLADTHFGKAAHFRKAGIPVPESIHLDDFHRISNLLDKTGASTVIFLGDLFHSESNESWFTLLEFIELFPQLNFHLVMGNHDILPETLYQGSTLKIHKGNLLLGNLILSHEPQKGLQKGSLNICGHIHPGIVIRKSSIQKFRLPAFYYKNNTLIMPAFGQFTGLYSMDLKTAECVMVATPEKVIPIKLNNKVG